MREDDGRFSILVVCTGNVCRSPLVERLLAVRLASALGDKARRYGISSAGVGALVGEPMDPPAAAELRRLGGDPTGFVARQLPWEEVESADIVLTATRAHRSFILTENPRALPRCFTIPEFASLAGVVPHPGSLVDLVAGAVRIRGTSDVDSFDVTDPYGAPPEVHRRVADTLASCVDGLVGALSVVT